MRNKLPKTPFSTPFSPSKKMLEARIRGVIAGPQNRPPLPLLALVLAFCFFSVNLFSCQEAEVQDVPAPETGDLTPETPGGSSDPAAPDASSVSGRWAVAVIPGYAPQNGDEGRLLMALFEAADAEEPFQLPEAGLLACVEGDGCLLGAVYVTDHLENTLILGVMDTETGELTGSVFRYAFHGAFPNVVTWRDRGAGYLLYTFNGQMMGQYSGQAGLVRLNGAGLTWEWPVEGDIREADSAVRQEYLDYWMSHHALLAPGGVDIYEVNPDFVWGAEEPASMWSFDHNEYFYRAGEADLPMPIYFQSLSWLNETTGDPGGWQVTALLPNERFPVPDEGADSFTLLARTDDNSRYLAANLVFLYEEENGRRVYDSLVHLTASDMGELSPGADVRLGDSWDQVRAAYPDLREDGYPVGWYSYLWYCSGDPQSAPAYVFLFENDVLVDIALRPPLGGEGW